MAKNLIQHFVLDVAERAVVAPSLRVRGVCRAGERIVIAYFCYTAMLAMTHGLGGVRVALAWMLPLTLMTLAAIERFYSRRWSSMVRDWAPLSLTLVGYWQMDWFAEPGKARLDHLWLGFDRFLLDRAGLQGAIEFLGGSIPSALEFIYLCLYALPPLCMAALYVTGARRRADQFLLTFFLGTFTAYALLPLFPTSSPRVSFPNADLPHYASIWRTVNVWLLDRCDITTSVFPSGHVAAGFSCGFGLLRAIPEKRSLWMGAFVAASLVYVATVYCRYHYAADGLASIIISATAWLASTALEKE